MKLTKSAQNTVLRLQIELTKSVTIHTARRSWRGLNLIFEEYDQLASWSLCSFHSLINRLIDCSTYCLQNLGTDFFIIYFTYKYKRARHTRLCWHEINPVLLSLFSVNIKEDSYESWRCKSRKHWCCYWGKSPLSTWNWGSTCRNWILLCLPHW